MQTKDAVSRQRKTGLSACEGSLGGSTGSLWYNGSMVRFDHPRAWDNASFAGSESNLWASRLVDVQPTALHQLRSL